MDSQYLFSFLVVLFCANLVRGQMSPSSFDQQFYEDSLDEELCTEQLAFLSNHSLRYQFLDASGRIPSGFTKGNLNDLGDYYQCIGINHVELEMKIEGKYCMMVIPLDQKWPTRPDWNITIPEIPGNITVPELPGNITWPLFPEEDAKMKRVSQTYAGTMNKTTDQISFNRVFPTFRNAAQGMTIAICVPKVCSTKQAIKIVNQNFPVNLTAEEYFCRLPGDKPLVTVDYVAIVIFSCLGLLNVMSTTYDLVNKYYLKRDDKEISTLLRSFSLYTNTRRLLTFNRVPGSLDCVDGIRALSMMWVVLGHTFAFTLLAYIHNAAAILDWLTSFNSTLINAAPITVDTFFMLTGLLVVYTTIGKISRGQFHRAIHLFYLNRLLRMFPLLAAIVLFQASLANHISDGPYWINVAGAVQNCRDYWWSALLHIQNYVNPTRMCIIQSWYLSVDTQLYVVSPLILWWLWGHRNSAWSALIAGLLLSLVLSSVYSFLYNFSAAVANFSRLSQISDYQKKYYFNTLTRAPPFFVGMVYGYMLHVYRDKKIRISKMVSLLLWLLSLLMMLFCIISIYPVMQPDHTAQGFDNFLNAYMRAIWAAGLGWLIFACTTGYGGPINWFLSLPLWKLPARLSFAMYLVHVPIIMIVNGTWVKTYYFTGFDSTYRFASDLSITFVAAFIMCVTIDAPFSTLQKLLFGGGKRRPEKRTKSIETIVDTINDDIIKTSL